MSRFERGIANAHFGAVCRKEPLPTFHPEFGRFMLEATPGKPWGIGFKDLLLVESNMKWR